MASPPGPHTLYFAAKGTCGTVATPFPLDVAGPDAPPPATTPAPAPAATAAGAGGCITVNVDLPSPQMVVAPPFVMAGEAYDPNAEPGEIAAETPAPIAPEPEAAKP